MQYCPSCRTELVDYAHFCGHCGRTLGNEAATHATAESRHSLLTRQLDASDATVKLPVLMSTIPTMDKQSPGTTSTNPLILSHPHKVLGKLPMPVRHVISSLI